MTHDATVLEIAWKSLSVVFERFCSSAENAPFIYPRSFHRDKAGSRDRTMRELCSMIQSESVRRQVVTVRVKLLSFMHFCSSSSVIFFFFCFFLSKSFHVCEKSSISKNRNQKVLATLFSWSEHDKHVSSAAVRLFSFSLSLHWLYVSWKSSSAFIICFC